jgi:DNA-binding FadR family transcriptional regulator
VVVHDQIFKHAGNASLAIFARLLQGVIRQVYRRTGQLASSAERRRAVRSYRAFHELVGAGDADGAREHWRLHMSYATGAARSSR